MQTVHELGTNAVPLGEQEQAGEVQTTPHNLPRPAQFWCGPRYQTEKVEFYVMRDEPSRD